MTIRGYLFDTEQQCQEAIYTINNSLGLPNEIHDTHSIPKQNGDGKWFIQEDDNSVRILGSGVEFEFQTFDFNT